MKKLFTILLVLMLSLMVVGSVFANGGLGPQPGQPQCTLHATTPSVWEEADGDPCYCPPGSTGSLAPGCLVGPREPEEDGTCAKGRIMPVVGDGMCYNRVAWACGHWTEPVCYGLCDEDVRRWPNEFEYSEWSAFVWDAAQERYVSTRTSTAYQIFVDAHYGEPVCRRVERAPTTEYQYLGRYEVIVGVRLRCAPPDSEGTIWQLIAGVRVDPAGKATLTFDDIGYPSSESFHTAFGKYIWSAEASEGYKILGATGGTIEITESDCNAPGAPTIHIGTGPSGQPINLSLVVLMGLIGVSALSAGVVVVRRSRL